MIHNLCTYGKGLQVVALVGVAAPVKQIAMRRFKVPEQHGVGGTLPKAFSYAGAFTPGPTRLPDGLAAGVTHVIKTRECWTVVLSNRAGPHYGFRH